MTLDGKLVSEDARCLGCGYALRGLVENRCPECGRGFDLADPKTVALGQRIPGWFGRLLLRRTGWVTTLLIVAAAGTLAWTTGRPSVVRPMLADTLYFADVPNWPANGVRGELAAYAVAAIAAAGLLTLCVVRLVARSIAVRVYARASAATRLVRLRQVVLLLAFAASATFVLFGWPVRVARYWHEYEAASMAQPPATRRLLTWRPAGPIWLAPADRLTALSQGYTDGVRRVDRLNALNLLIGFFPDESVGVLERAIPAERDPYFRALAVNVLCLDHNEAHAPLFVRLLDDPATEVRAAAADAVGYLRGPGPFRPMSNWFIDAPAQLATDPPVNVGSLRHMTVWQSWPPSNQPAAPLPAVPFDPAIRDRLDRLMTAGETAAEREAAARTLTNWPPTAYSLRCAEWGVWVANPTGDLNLVQGILDEIPPFVHRIGNTHASLADRYMRYFGTVTKPIVHLTADRPLALDVEVRIREGRPWFAYPKFDDLILSHEEPPPRDLNDRHLPATTGPDVAALEPPSFPTIPDLREGYPWLRPAHRPHYGAPMARGTPISTSLGLRWQSLTVSPTRAAWMTSPAIPADPKYAWWAALRGVPSSYVASRGESERFLYYDGPTRALPPLLAKLAGRSVELTPVIVEKPPAYAYHRAHEITPLRQPPSAARDDREAFLIRVTGGRASAWRVAIPTVMSPSRAVRELMREQGFTRAEAERVAAEFKHPTEEPAPVTLTLPDPLPVPAADAATAFTRMLTDYGLTAEEAGGLTAAWRQQLFQKDGTRLLLRLSAADYDDLCPLSVKPPPTELVRVGLVLTEF